LLEEVYKEILGTLTIYYLRGALAGLHAGLDTEGFAKGFEPLLGINADPS